MNGSMVNDRPVKAGQTISLNNGDVIIFGQEPQQFVFQYAAPSKEAQSPLMVDDKVSLVNKAKPTYARIDHLAAAQSQAPKTSVLPRLTL